MTNKDKRIVRNIMKRIAGDRLDYLEEREALAANIRKREEAGKVAVVYGGLDCDCTRFDNRVRLLPSIVPAVIAWERSFYDGAEGPQWWRLERPSSAKSLKASSRDLALEAFENGHPRVVYL